MEKKYDSMNNPAWEVQVYRVKCKVTGKREQNLNSCHVTQLLPELSPQPKKTGLSPEANNIKT